MGARARISMVVLGLLINESYAYSIVQFARVMGAHVWCTLTNILNTVSKSECIKYVVTLNIALNVSSWYVAIFLSYTAWECV